MNKFDISLKLIRQINNLGYEAYIIGGAIRDYLVGIETNDYDITTNMPLDLIQSTFDYIDNGSNYLSITIKYENEEFEITHFRKDISYSDNRHPVVELCDTLKEDTYRRDYTINALAMDCNKNIIDYHNGLDDINNKLIRTIGNPDIRFNEDSLRILRGLHFSAKLGFDIEEATLNSMVKNKKLLSNLSDERLYDYLIKIVYSNNDKAIKYINKYDLFEYINDYKLWLDIIDKSINILYIGYIYYLKYNKYPPYISKKDRKVCDKIKLLADNNFDILSLYYNRQIYDIIRPALVYLNYDVDYYDHIVNNLKIKNNNELAVKPNVISTLVEKDKISTVIDKIIYSILKGEINNTEKDIINFIKKV